MHRSRQGSADLRNYPPIRPSRWRGFGWLPDTILSRSVIIRMRRRKPDEKVDPFRSRLHAGEGSRVRSLIELWASTVPPEIEYPDLPAAIADRDADVWEPLITCAALAGGEWPARARAAAIALLKVAMMPSLALASGCWRTCGRSSKTR